MAESELAIIHGPPLAEEPGLGALTLPGWLREVCTAHGPREALVLHEAGARTSWTYAETWDRAVEVARALIAIGCGKDARVGVLMTNRPEWVAAMFGAAIAGCVAVPLSTFSTVSELDALLRRSAVSVLLAERLVAKSDFAAMLGELEPDWAGGRSTRYPFLRHLALIGEVPGGSPWEDWDAFRARAAGVPAELAEATAAEVLPADVAAILFSSGSTATPKGIVNSHRGIAIHLWRWRRIFGLEGEVRAWTPNGFFWSGNFGSVLGATFTAGGALVLQRTFDPAEALELIASERVNYPTAWPHQWKAMAEQPSWDSLDFSVLRYIDPMHPIAHHPSVTLAGWEEPYATYGSTETFTITAAYPSNTPKSVTGGSHGAALCGNTIRIVDPITGETLRRGEHGEIAVKGPTLMLHYLGRTPEESFDDQGFHRSGDAGWIDDAGHLRFTGRLTTVIKTGGANVSPLEVDPVLEAMPGVKVARLVGVPDDALGELAVALVVPQQGVTLEAKAVRAFARERLAAYKVPRRVLFLAPHEIALTGSAKTKPAELRELAIRKLGEAVTPR